LSRKGKGGLPFILIVSSWGWRRGKRRQETKGGDSLVGGGTNQEREKRKFGEVNGESFSSRGNIRGIRGRKDRYGNGDGKGTRGEEAWRMEKRLWG